jgi:hypothetical protein
MPKPPTPPDLKNCEKCGKLIGPHGGWFGAECQCGIDLSKAIGRAHSVGSKTG